MNVVVDAPSVVTSQSDTAPKLTRLYVRLTERVVTSQSDTAPKRTREPRRR